MNERAGARALPMYPAQVESRSRFLCHSIQALSGMFLRAGLSYLLEDTMPKKMKRPFGRCRCWAARLAAWVTYLAIPGPGRWMDNKLFMLTAPRCIWLIVMGLNPAS